MPQLGQTFSDVVHEQLVEGLGQIFGSGPVLEHAVHRVRAEVLLLRLARGIDAHMVVDVLQVYCVRTKGERGKKRKTLSSHACGY